ncbi:Inherit from COG: Methyltransferase [Seminavis robusta]|uniref:Inherit from COG: Methyltransferase n=1 Tax=Seminavis robusta TaxID=568900 RepID=A0A9N8DEH8_9STRA|nr:Inherit from COG: Methyltransferase [Seminavis robusta]|eukprot:Sro111_g055260.1 Inherit from COG: Methyltransferase (432) ;mRNA; f:51174-52469
MPRLLSINGSPRHGSPRHGSPRKGNLLGKLQSAYSLHPMVVMVALGLFGLTGVFHFYQSGDNSHHPEHRQTLLHLQQSPPQQSTPQPSTPNTNPKLRDPGDMIPMDCPAYLKQHIDGKLDDPNEGVVHAAQVPRGNDHHPNFFVSLHTKAFDYTRWIIMDKRDYYEKALTAAFIEVLNDPTTTRPQRVIDVGGNIGFFTHLSAANGPVIVDAFEPNGKNRLRFCESLHLNRWTSEFEETNPAAFAQQSHVNLYDYGVSKDPGYLNFRQHSNPGMGRFVRRNANDEGKGTRVINLDQLARTRGWFESRTDIAILKVDVEGFDPFVIEGASALLQAKLIRHVFMEISVQPAGQDAKDAIDANKVAIKLLFQSGYELYKMGGWNGPDRLVDFSKETFILNRNDEDAKTDRIIEWAQRERAKQLNLWWRLPTARK